MPWRIIENHPECNGYAVVKEDDGKLFGCHKTRGDAIRHMAALYAAERDEKYERLVDKIAKIFAKKSNAN